PGSTTQSPYEYAGYERRLHFPYVVYGLLGQWSIFQNIVRGHRVRISSFPVAQQTVPAKRDGFPVVHGPGVRRGRYRLSKLGQIPGKRQKTPLLRTACRATGPRSEVLIAFRSTPV